MSQFPCVHCIWFNKCKKATQINYQGCDKRVDEGWSPI